MSDITISTQTYSGWSNRETWLASLWLNNDRGLHVLFGEALKESEDVSGAASCLEEQLHEQLFGEIEVACLWQDLLQTAFSKIDWTEIIIKNAD